MTAGPVAIATFATMVNPALYIRCSTGISFCVSLIY